MHTVITTSAPDDVDIFTRIQAGDSQAFATFMTRYQPAVFRVVLRVLNNHSDSEDLAQEIWAEVWRKRQSYRRDSGLPLGWLITMARRRAIDAVRSSQSYRAAIDRAAESIEQTYLEPVMPVADEIGATRELLAKAARRANLTPILRQSFEACYVDGLSQREAAVKLSIPRSTVRNRAEQARLLMKDAILSLLS